MDTNKKQNICEGCFRIACKRCSWIATEVEVAEIQQGILKACPLCGWKPGEEI